MTLVSRNFAALLAAVLAVVLATLLGTPAATAQTLAPPQNVLVLAAEASAEVVQDTLTITLQTSRDGPEAAMVQTQLRQLLDAALVEARKAVRPGQLELRTGVFSIYPRYASKPAGGNAIVGWQGRAELLLEGRDIAAISQLAGRLGNPGNPGNPGGAGGAGGMTVSRMMFSLSREAREAAEADVASRAIARFKGRAESYARQFGFGGYSLREVNVGGGDFAPPVGQPMLRGARAMASSSADEIQPVEAGKALVSVTVSGSIQLSPK